MNNLYPWIRVYGPLLEIVSFISHRFNEPLRRSSDKRVVALREELVDAGLPPVQILNRLKEGGCYVYFEDMETALKAMTYISRHKISGRSLGVFIVQACDGIYEQDV